MHDDDEKPKYKYDLAFSFLAKDEGVASQLNELLKPRLTTFFYSEKQKELAGRDGEHVFNQAFGEESRTVVILYREEWGETPWTRVEKTAIKNRAHDEGYDFTFFVCMDKKLKPPKWYPKNYIWFDYERWGAEGAAPAIESKAQEFGGTPHEETLEERAQRQKEEIHAENLRKNFLRSEAGVIAAKQEVSKLHQIVQDKVPKIDIQIQAVVKNSQLYMLYNRIGMSVDWQYHFANSLEESSLEVTLWNGAPPVPGNYFIDRSTPIKRQKYVFDKDWNGNMGWRRSYSDSTLMNTDRLADECLKLLLDRVHEKLTTKRALG
jgi:hypothetical protein